MKSELNTQKINELLKVSLTRIKPATQEALRAARTKALEHQRQPQSVPVLAWAGRINAKYDIFNLYRPSSWALALIFAACLASGATYFNRYLNEREISDIDIAILTDELPLHVYVD